MRCSTPFGIGSTIWVIQRKPGAFRSVAPFPEMPDAFRRLQQHLAKQRGGDREVAEILVLVLQHDEHSVLTAVEMALEAGVPTKTHMARHSSIGWSAADQLWHLAWTRPWPLALREEPGACRPGHDDLRRLLKGGRPAS